MRIRAVMLLSWLAGLMLLAGCTSGYQTVNVPGAYEMTKDPNVEIIDVRTPEEYAAGHVPGSKLLPLQTIDDWHLSLDKKKTYLMVCRSGNRSGQASAYLAGKGYANVFNMAGGMNEWTYDVEK